MKPHRFVPAALVALAVACARQSPVSAIYTSVNGDAELFPCAPSKDMWHVNDSSLGATYARLGGGRLFVRLSGTTLDSGSIYGARHTFAVRQVLEARVATPDECRATATLPSFAAPLPPGDPVPPDLAPGLLGFTQRFYDWYVPLMLNGQASPAWDLTLRPRRASFDTSLMRALKDDADASARESNDVVGLDFDPFVAAQDPCDKYEVGAASKHGERYWVEVFGVCQGRKHHDADLIAEIERRQDAWVFVNFRYPDGDDLVATLKKLKAERAGQPPRAAR